MIDRKVALVTGGGRGIGRAVSVELARTGFAVAIVFREDLAAAQTASAQCEEAGAPVELCQADVASASDRELMVEFVLERFGRVDLLVNNAGIAPDKRVDILDTPEESFDRVLAVNLKAPYFLSQTVAHAMIQLRQQGDIERGDIVNVNSIRAYTAGVNYGEYCVSKAGLSMVTALFAARLAEHDIHVHEISAGLIETDMTAPKEVREMYNRKLAAGHSPINRWGTPQEVARAVAAIARGDFPFSTGQTFHVDGGWHLRQL